MGREIKKYKFTLGTLSPVFIGSGQTYTTKEYLLEGQDIYFPDMTKVYQHVAKKAPHKLSHYEEFLMAGRRRDNRREDRLPDILKRLDIKERDFGGYHLSVSNVDFQTTGGRVNEIAAFIKDAFGRPYIPGSSLKGALRTIICNVKFGGDNSRGTRQHPRNPRLIPWGAKSKQAYQDFFHDIRVSDSHAISLQRLVVCQKIDYSKRKERLNTLPIARECLRPYSKVEFTVTCEGSEAIDAMERLVEWSRKHYKAYKDFYLDQETKTEYVQSTVPKAGVLYLGGGSGFWTKTIIKDAVRPRGNRRMMMVGKGVHKLTKARIPDARLANNEHLFEMGKCVFFVEAL